MASATESPARRLSVDRRRQQLLEIGMRLFAESPYDQVSTDVLAQRAGISKGLLYHYFDGKRGYYVCTIREVARRFLEATDPPTAGGRVAALQSSVVGCIAFIEANSEIYQALARGGLGADAEVNDILEESRCTTVDRLLERLGPIEAPAEPLRLALHGWVGFVEGSILEWLRNRAIDESTLAQIHVAAFHAIVTMPLSRPESG